MYLPVRNAADRGCTSTSCPLRPTLACQTHVVSPPAVAAARFAAPVIAVVGPTASGKSDLAVELAVVLNGEIVNADAMQLYRGMDIGTAKLPVPERRGVPHHQLDVLEVTDEASVAAYQREARAAIEDIRSRGRRPILAGGSGLYLRAVLDELQIPPTDPRVRAALETELEQIGATALHTRLAERDPAAAAAILPSNARRVVRALEVIALTGRPFTATLPTGAYHQPAIQIGLQVPRPVLDERIATRVERMWDAGLVAETRDLAELHGLRAGRTASRALGYAQVLQLLDGELDDAAARLATVTATRRFARRQLSWFGRDPRITWLDHDAADLIARAVQRCAP
ncbi:MAG: tRNA (adenosine(37)-N6)-dimethylallyltransferase MiaA [Kineosporiaceae bacterium]|nr:tRNA (adenosine(37)-N6)-dimethylallyltransferase MiaA [Kineosporiaceae bacterium]